MGQSGSWSWQLSDIGSAGDAAHRRHGVRAAHPRGPHDYERLLVPTVRQHAPGRTLRGPDLLPDQHLSGSGRQARLLQVDQAQLRRHRFLPDGRVAELAVEA